MSGFHHISLTELTSQRLTPSEFVGKVSKSKDIIPKSVDKAMDKSNPACKNAAPGISIRNGPVEERDGVEAPHISSKRKARETMNNGTSYKEARESEEDDKPLVSHKQPLFVVEAHMSDRCLE